MSDPSPERMMEPLPGVAIIVDVYPHNIRPA
jgi:hypothetical protein